MKLTDSGFEAEYTEETAKKNLEKYAAIFSTQESLQSQLTAAQAEIARLREALKSVDEFIARTPMLNQGELAVMVPRIRKSYEKALNKGAL